MLRRLFALLAALALATGFVTTAHADDEATERRWSTLPLFVASGGIAVTSGKAAAAASRETTVGGYGGLAGCACGYLRLGDGYLFGGIYGDFLLGINANGSGPLLAELSFGPVVTYGLSDEHEIGVRYRASVFANLARDVGASDDSYLIDVLGRFRNTGAHVGFSTELVSFPLMKPFPNQLRRISVGVFQRFGEEEKHAARRGAYYVGLDLDTFAPKADVGETYSGFEVRASFGWGFGSD